MDKIKRKEMESKLGKDFESSSNEDFKNNSFNNIEDKAKDKNNETELNYMKSDESMRDRGEQKLTMESMFRNFISN